MNDRDKIDLREYIEVLLREYKEQINLRFDSQEKAVAEARRALERSSKKDFEGFSTIMSIVALAVAVGTGIIILLKH